MSTIWNITYYQSPSQGTSPIADFIEKLDVKIQAKVSNTFDLLEQYGIRLGLPHVKKLSGTELWELRILGKDNIRFFYIAIHHRSFLLLHGFVKKSQKQKRSIFILLKNDGRNINQEDEDCFITKL